MFKAQISLDSLEYIIFFLLRYYRDGIGEAEHIDIDFPFLNSKNEEFVTLTVRLKEYIERPGEELAKQLGIDL